MFKTAFSNGVTMKKSDEVKERIIEATTRLIVQSDGDVMDINTRAIAQEAQVGTGLINYHFQTKENLIEICVERMISKVIAAFDPAVQQQQPAARLKQTAKLVFDFLVENPAVSRISILTDHKQPKADDNTMKSTGGMYRVLGGSGDLEVPGASGDPGNPGDPGSAQFLLTFALVSTMQALFLRKEQSGELFGYDIRVKAQRDEALDLLVGTLFGGREDE